MKKINLAGLWQFKMDEQKIGITDNYFSEPFTDSISLPGTTAMAGKGNYNTASEIGTLTENYPYKGYAWYAKDITLSDYRTGMPVKLYLERTRISHVWVNGQFAGTYDSLCAPHLYDLTPYISDTALHLVIMVDNSSYVTKGGHMTSPDTQTNWNGITGTLELRLMDALYIEDIKTTPDIKTGHVRLDLQIMNTTAAVQQTAWLLEADRLSLDSDQPNAAPSQKLLLELQPGMNEICRTYTMPDNYERWEADNPVCYRLRFVSQEGTYYGETVFGMRDFAAAAHHFTINGREVFLRGKHDGLIFPLTGAAPSDLSEWIRIFSIAKEYGINHYRYHTCCPPETAFLAADLTGIYMQPELPFWGNITTPADDTHSEEEQAFLIKEGERMLKWYGNHASFVMMSLGNELWGSSETMARILRHYKELDGRHLYSEGCNNFQFSPIILEEDDFFVGVRFSKHRLIRGSYGMCDAPLGFIQTDAPNTVHSFDPHILPPADTVSEQTTEEAEVIEIQYETGTKKVVMENHGSLIPEKPVISHETGQYAIYPDFREIEKYTGVLRADNFKTFRTRLADQGMLHLADAFFHASGKLAAACYKLEIEAALRSRYLAGFQLLDLQDFSGQGTALVGILDAFMDNKGLISAKEWRMFCENTVLLAELETFVYTAGTPFSAKILLHNYSPVTHIEDTLKWTLSADNTVFAEGCIPVAADLGLTDAAVISAELPDFNQIRKISFDIRLQNSGISNQYTLWVYPELPASVNASLITAPVHLTEDAAEAQELLSQGETVVLITDQVKNSLEGFYCTDFWCYPMFRSISESMNKPVPHGTMGLYIRPEHPALQEFSTEFYATPQWYEIVSSGVFTILDGLDEAYEPIVQPIDNFGRNHKLGFVFEAAVQAGKLLVCSADKKKLEETIQGRHLIKSLCSYAGSDSFAPVEVDDFMKVIG